MKSGLMILLFTSRPEFMIQLYRAMASNVLIQHPPHRLGFGFS
jgi:hypothetical protein